MREIGSPKEGNTQPPRSLGPSGTVTAFIIGKMHTNILKEVRDEAEYGT